LKIRQKQECGLVQIIETSRYLGISLVRRFPRVIERKLKASSASDGGIGRNRFGKNQIDNSKRKFARPYGWRLSINKYGFEADAELPDLVLSLLFSATVDTLLFTITPRLRYG
jgi:hypothetical protein